jgi:hypothetical protein
MNKELEQAAKAYARDHSAAPDKETPDWIIADFIAGANYANQQKSQLSNEFNAEEFGNYTARYSIQDRFNAISILLCQVPMLIEDLQDIVEILKENRDKLLPPPVIETKQG